MELDEALLKIVELEETIKNQDTTMDNLRNDITTKNNEIVRLQKSNMELFLKITNNTNENDIINQGDIINEDEIEQVSKMDKLLNEWGV